MSYRLIEARFQILDEAVARLDRAKHTKLNASAGLRGCVRVNPHDVATWIKPNRPRSTSSVAFPPSSDGSSHSTATSCGAESSTATPSFNQSTHDVHLTLRRSTLLTRQTKAEVHPLIVQPTPATHDWGHPHDDTDQHFQDNQILAKVDPKEAKVHRVALDTWERINQEIQASTGMDVAAITISSPPPSGRLTKSATMARPRAPARQPTSSSLDYPALRRSPKSSRSRRHHVESFEEPADDEGCANGAHNSTKGPENNARQPPDHLRPPSRTRGRLVSQPRILRPALTTRDWFSRQEPDKSSPHSSRPSEAAPGSRRRRESRHRRHRASGSEDGAPGPPRGSDDPAYYYLEIRLEHATSLAGWTFRVIVTDTTHPAQPAALFNHMQCDASNCIVFDKPPAPKPTGRKTKTVASTEPMLRPTIFDPMRFFDHARQPFDLYGHSLRVQVVSEWPVQKTIVDTMVHFTDTNTGPALSADELLQTLSGNAGNKPEPLIVDDGAKAEAPPSTHDNSEYIYRNHFETIYGTDLKADSSTAKPHDQVAPAKKPAAVPVFNTNDVEEKKRELQRMRETMMDDMLREQQREQQRLASFR